MQAQEVAQHEPDCKLYFAMTKCDQLNQPPGIGNDSSTLEPSPQESGNQHTLLCNYHSSNATASYCTEDCATTAFVKAKHYDSTPMAEQPFIVLQCC